MTSLAFDRSVRSFDKDGRLHVALTNISKANVCPYYGREIPNGEALGLDANKIYRLLRDPEELAKGALTFNNIPLLIKHVPVTSAEPRRELVVGSTGTDAVFGSPFLRNSLVVWDDEAIAGIESEEQKELSAAYHYVADMTPGEYEGESYDGVMRSIIGNHVALVEEGRAGPDVVVGDSKLEQNKMSKKTVALLSRKALLVQGALAAYLTPRLAADAQIDLTPVLKDVNRSNYAKKRASIATGVEKLVSGKLAQDAEVGDLVELLDGLKDVNSGDPDEDDLSLDDEDEPGAPPAAAAPEPEADDPVAKLLAVLKGKLDEETFAKVSAALAPAPAAAAPGADDEPTPKPEEEKPVAKDEDQDGDKETPPTKAAMDAAILKARNQTRKETIATMNAIREAEAICKPIIGELAVAMDSAESIYQLALETAEVDLTGVPPAAFKAMVGMLPKGGNKPEPRLQIGQDAKAAASFAERFPNAQRIKTV